jgi:urease alpha subunit
MKFPEPQGNDKQYGNKLWTSTSELVLPTVVLPLEDAYDDTQTRSLRRDRRCRRSRLPFHGTRAATPATYDVVIRNGRVLDGAGNPWILADVAIKDGRFAKIGRIASAGTTEIDAHGKYVSPGWIDMMDQSGACCRGTGMPRTSCARA